MAFITGWKEKFSATATNVFIEMLFVMQSRWQTGTLGDQRIGSLDNIPVVFVAKPFRSKKLTRLRWQVFLLARTPVCRKTSHV